MAAMEIEQPLHGGLAEGRVVRVGGTVRRPAGPWTAGVHALLRHVRSKGFPAPEPLGLDDEGREIVGFVEGEAGNWPWPAALLSERGPAQVGARLAALHAAVADFTAPEDAVWRLGPPRPGPGEIVLHGDFGPYNLIWRHGALAGVIDWDLAHPGPPIEDAAFAAIHCVPLRTDEAAAQVGFAAPPDRRARLADFARAYGRFSPAQLVAGALALMVKNLAVMRRLGGDGLEPWAGWLRRGLAEREEADLTWLRDAAGSLGGVSITTGIAGNRRLPHPGPAGRPSP